MTLLTLLALGLLSLSTITLRQSGSGTAMATARNNARLALMLALGELQKQVGPDQRVTATADIASAAKGEILPAGAAPQNNVSVNGDAKGLSNIQNGTRYWTGVWKNKNVTNPETEIYTKTPSPDLVKWLISGNEASTSTTTITPGSSVAALGSNGKTSDPTKAVILVGKNTVGEAGATYAGASGPNLLHYVSAPLVSMKTSSSAKTNGRYGWWVGDEGVKARLNRAADSGALTYENLSTVRRGWETTALKQYPVPLGGSDANLNRLVTLSQSELLASQYKDGGSGAVGQIFHAATSDSNSVLTDTLAGGLRMDLSAYLESLPSGALPNVPNSPTTAKNIIPSSVSSTLKGPTWDRLKAFKDTYAGLSGGKLVCTAATDEKKYAVGPVISDIRILMGVKLEPVAGSTTEFKIHGCSKVAVVLANPYAYPLTWNTDLDLELKCDKPAGASSSLQPSRIWEINPKVAYLPNTDTENAVLNNVVFRIKKGDTLPAGGAKAYTIGSQVVRDPAATPMSTTQVVPMVDFDNAGAANFDVNLLLVNTNKYTGTALMDVRELTTTSPLTAELRPAGDKTNIIRRIERFELDNANFSNTLGGGSGRITASYANAVKYTSAFPIMHYSFQISQPGTNYGTILYGSDVGLRSSTQRTFADFNMQCTRFRKTISSYNPVPFFMESTYALTALDNAPPGGSSGLVFTKNLLSPVSWGGSSLDTRNVVLFTAPQSLASLAQFQHADLTADDLFVSVGHQPGNAVGNSYATPFVQRDLVKQQRTDYFLNAQTYYSVTTQPTNYYDMAYLLNSALWDSYYFSTIPRAGATSEPVSKAIVKISGADQSTELRDGMKAAGHLLVGGGFNINSTEKDAWKALLAGSKFLKHSAGGSSTDAMFPRSLEQTKADANPPSGTKDDSYAGFRRLTDDQIDAVATEIVKQVRLRGPFVSLSQFVNRALVGIDDKGTTDKNTLSRSGALQGALDNAKGVNITPDGGTSGFKSLSVSIDRMNLQDDGGKPKADMMGPSPKTTPADLVNTGDWGPNSWDQNGGSVASNVADRVMLSTLKNEQGFRSTGIPGWVTQADVLQVIGSSLTARSDTFRIRAYGEAVDSESGTTTARAWCEAVVQRTPQYVDTANQPSDRGAALKPLNRTFGRSFSVVSFRWLSPDEI
ncbi:MAG: hypothetical protein QM755_10245 [Luteolibacter sp.]